MESISVALVDDHQLFRRGLAGILDDADGIDVAYEADNGKQFVDRLAAGDVPDLVLLDLEMPEMGGMQVVEVLNKDYPDVRVVLLTMHNDDRFVLHFMESGAGAYLLKNAHPDEVEQAIRDVVSKGFYVNDHVAQTMLKGMSRKRQPTPALPQNSDLTPKEVEVLRLICLEQTTPQIAEQLFLSPRTIEGHRKRMLEKTGAKNTAGLVMYAVRYGLVNIGS